ncbi:MAG TPA: hypothetical protein VM692_00640, partial [Gammaproteobacteria bacterium]|nr:hypothetical protein [Gammaproteobacteria bacterium]
KGSFDDAPFHHLFRVLAEIRAASADSLDELFFQRVFLKQCRRSTNGMLARLVEEGFLARMDLKQARVIYHLTRKSLATIEVAGIHVPETLRRPPTDELGQVFWLRASLRAEHSRLGFTVGRGPREAYALRRFLIDSVERSAASRALLAELRADPALCPPMTDGCERCGFIAAYGAARAMCPRCANITSPVPLGRAFKCATCDVIAATPGPHGRCTALMRELECLPVDVAWRKVGERYDVRIVFVDNPVHGLRAQLEKLPVQHMDQPKVPILLRSADPESRYDRGNAAWASKGPRHQLLDAAFSEEGLNDLWPIESTTRVIDVRPDLQLYVLRSDARAPAWDCGVLGAGQGKAPRERAKAILTERNAERLVRDREERHEVRGRVEAAKPVIRREERAIAPRTAPRIKREEERAPRRRR